MKRFIFAVLVIFCWSLISNSPSSVAQSAQQPIDGAARGNNGIGPVLQGSVSVDGGPVSAAQNAEIALDCGDLNKRTNVDLTGAFTFRLDSQNSAEDPQHLQRSIVAPLNTFCTLYADAPGYTSEQIYVRIEPGEQIQEAGTLVLHPLSRQGDNEKYTVSIVSLAAPAKARKAFEKGQKAVHKQLWESATTFFVQAVTIYPRYAIAWLALGRAQRQQSNLSGALQSFEQASAADPHLLIAYAELMSTAAHLNKWPLVLRASEHIIEGDPDATPDIWFFNSAAKLNLGDVSGAESGVTRGLRVDRQHNVPQLEYLYGLILGNKHQYLEAAEHMKAYLRLCPHATDKEDVRNSIAQLERAAAQ